MSVKGYEQLATTGSIASLLNTSGVFVDDHEVILKNHGPCPAAIGDSGSAYHILGPGEELRFKSVAPTQISCKAYAALGGNQDNALVTALVIGELV